MFRVGANPPSGSVAASGSVTVALDDNVDEIRVTIVGTGAGSVKPNFTIGGTGYTSHEAYAISNDTRIIKAANAKSLTITETGDANPIAFRVSAYKEN